MDHAKPLPSYLIRRFHGWKATEYEENKGWYENLALGQHPRAMVISCCDSRVHMTEIFGAEQGEFFMHRNIANLVPPFAPDEHYHGTSAAVEFAVTALKVAHLLVVGHSSCGGVQHCHDICSGQIEPKQDSFVSNWVSILDRGYDRLKQNGEVAVGDLEKEAVIVSLENLMTFPFVETAVKEGHLSLHGLWHSIGTGRLDHYDPQAGGFVEIF